jgi:uncharacterized protein YbaR (Trm112 family)
MNTTIEEIQSRVSPRPSREEYVADRIERAMKHLMSVSACPDCKHTEHEHSELGRDDHHQIMRCTHIWHCVPLCEGDPWMMAIGLPNCLWTQTGEGLRNVQSMQRRALEYAIREKP